ncbi:hypothetical protein BMS3Bbin04_01730 [bacterium BMS3Bbin04]|nr:hypothetical protein BMS3Bbin04_01730 [bacterium BMS3Bbin04]
MGGTFSYIAQIEYTGWTPVTFRAWVRLILPSGAVYPPPLAGPTTFTWFAPTLTPLYSFTQTIPAFAPPGTYYVQGVLADVFSGFTTVYDSDNFPFQKLLIGPDGVDDEMTPEWESSGAFEIAADSPVEDNVDMPETFTVSEAYPNPFNPSTSISLNLGVSSQLTVVVYDVQGREIATLANGHFQAGQHSFSWVAQGLASGVYFLRATAGSEVQTRKLILMQ